MINKTCLTCKKEFQVSKYREKSCKYCSVSCKNIARIGNVLPNSGQFKKGIIPWSKGKKGAQIGWLKGKKGYTNNGSFKEGHIGYKARLIHGKSKTPEYRSMYQNIRRSRKKSNGFYTLKEWELLKKQYGYICPSCKRKEPEIVLGGDHIIPLSKGGSNFIENIQPLCKSCNSKKNIKVIKFEVIHE